MIITSLKYLSYMFICQLIILQTAVSGDLTIGDVDVSIRRLLTAVSRCMLMMKSVSLLNEPAGIYI